MQLVDDKEGGVSSKFATYAHWSLLLIKGKELLHYDSCSGTNLALAREYIPILSALAQRKLVFSEVAFEQQQNGYDCGLHVVLNACGSARSAKEMRQVLKALQE